jgi:hypothetical protein
MRNACMYGEVQNVVCKLALHRGLPHQQNEEDRTVVQCMGKCGDRQVGSERLADAKGQPEQQELEKACFCEVRCRKYAR